MRVLQLCKHHGGRISLCVVQLPNRICQRHVGRSTVGDPVHACTHTLSAEAVMHRVSPSLAEIAAAVAVAADDDDADKVRPRAATSGCMHA